MQALILLLIICTSAHSAVLISSSSHHKLLFERKVREVREILEQPSWYNQFMQLLRERLRSRDNFKIPLTESFSQHSRQARSTHEFPRLKANSKIEVSAELRLDGKTLLNIVKKANASKLGDSDEVIKAAIGSTQILLNVQVINKDSMTGPEAAESQFRQDEDPVGSEWPEPNVQWTKANIDNLADTLNNTMPISLPCTTDNFCYFGGTCTRYAIIDMQLCSCKRGFKGTRCELYDMPLALRTLEDAQKRGIIGKGPINPDDYEELLSVVESTALMQLAPPAE